MRAHDVLHNQADGRNAVWGVRACVNERGHDCARVPWYSLELLSDGRYRYDGGWVVMWISGTRKNEKRSTALANTARRCGAGINVQ